MAKKVIIFGTNASSKMVFYDAKGRDDFVVAGFTVDKEYLESDSFLGLPLVEFEKVAEEYPPQEYDMLVVASGYREHRMREQLYLRAKNTGYKLRNYISKGTDFVGEVTMGDNNIIYSQTYIGVDGVMGNNNIIGQQVYIAHNFIIGDNNFITPHTTIGGYCRIGNTCHLGFNCTIIEGIEIADETLVGAGSVIIRNTEPFSKIVGNPGHIIGYHKEEGISLNRL